MLKNADPYAVRNYLEAAVGAKSINASPAQVTAVKFSDGAGAVLVSAEAALVDIASGKEAFNADSAATGIDRRIENPFRPEKSEKADAKGKKADK